MLVNKGPTDTDALLNWFTEKKSCFVVLEDFCVILSTWPVTIKSFNNQFAKYQSI